MYLAWIASQPRTHSHQILQIHPLDHFNLRAVENVNYMDNNIVNMDACNVSTCN
jgi:hypothetical protein